MCGIAGVLQLGGFILDEIHQTKTQMKQALEKRGPDGSGDWISHDTNILFVHRRLSVLDLSLNASQPMISKNSRFVITFNGEIYNHLMLRKLFNNFKWKTLSDTETLLELISHYGLKKTLNLIEGMFAFAVYDCVNKKLYLARDRFGEKPLYYGWNGNTFIFGSTLSAMKCHPNFDRQINPIAVEKLLRSGYISAPHSIYTKTKKLLPGSFISLSSYSKDIKLEYYWNIDEVINTQINNRFKGSIEEAIIDLEQKLITAVNKQTISDVPIGAFLSGGIDSSLIVSLMQKNASNAINTYTIGFDDSDFNEANFAKNISAHLNTNHTEYFFSEKDTLSIIPQLNEIYDEPFADMSQLPTVLLSRLAKKNITVALSGDAADELFCGYNRYPSSLNKWKKLSMIPLGLRKYISNLSSKKYTELLNSSSADEFYHSMNMQWKGHPEMVKGITHYAANCFIDIPAVMDQKERMMYYDSKTYLPDDILVKVDRAAMSCSLETRVPYLDRDVVEFAWSLPIEIKYAHNTTKYPLKKILGKYIPKTYFNRPKMGFGVPINKWLKSELKDWADDLLSEKKLGNVGFLNIKAIRNEWGIHLSEKKDRHYQLWSILMFQNWLDGENKLG